MTEPEASVDDFKVHGAIFHSKVDLLQHVAHLLKIEKNTFERKSGVYFGERRMIRLLYG